MDKISKELECANPQLIQDIRVFTTMTIPRRDIVIDPDAYGEQLKRLEQHRKDNKANLTDFIKRNMENVIEALIQDLAHQPTRASYNDNGTNSYAYTGNHSHSTWDSHGDHSG